MTQPKTLTESVNTYTNPLPAQFPIIAGKIHRYETVTLKIAAPVAICRELVARIKGVPPLENLDAVEDYQSDNNLTLLAVTLSVTALSTLFIHAVTAVCVGISVYLGSTVLPRLHKQAQARAALEMVTRFSFEDIEALYTAAHALRNTAPMSNMIERSRSVRNTLDLPCELREKELLQWMVAHYLISCEHIKDFGTAIVSEQLCSISVPKRLRILFALRYFLSTQNGANTQPLSTECGHKHYPLSVELQRIQTTTKTASALAFS